MNEVAGRLARRVPLPTGPLTGRRTPLRRFLAEMAARLNRSLDCLPPARWLHRRICRSLELPELTLPLRPSAAGLEGLRVAFVSDVHAGSFLDEDDLCRIFARIQAAEPDLVLFGGDLVNTRASELRLFEKPLQLLRPRHGMFAVPGNHDHFWGADIADWVAYLEQCSVRVLVNRGCRIEHRSVHGRVEHGSVDHGSSSLWLCGVDDLTEGTPDLSAALSGRREGEPTILLSHHPDFFFEAAAVDVDLTLSGHTHGGQIRLAGWAPIHHSRFGYERGWFSENDCRLYVGRGVGVTVLPIRIDARPEIPIVTLRVPAALSHGRAALSPEHGTGNVAHALAQRD